MTEAPPVSRDGLCREIVQNLDEPVRLLNRDLCVVMANRAADRILQQPAGLPEGGCLIEHLQGHTQACEGCLVAATFEDGEPHRREMAGIDSNGDRWVTEIQTRPLTDNAGRVTHVIEIFRDKSHEKRLERQLFQSSKLVSIGEVATGIAHEIRNPLAGIRLGLDAMGPALESSPEATEILADITRDIVRLNRVVSDLLNFTSPRPHRPEWFPLKTLFDQVIRLIRKSTEERGVKLSVQVSPGDLELWGDRNQIHQVLLNILLNSLQAMPEGGELSLSGNQSQNINWSGERKERKGYRIVVRDTGIGIPEENMQRLFDPFFTTKSNGTGVGLTTSFTIIRKHNGELRINSKVGEGTTTQILLPEGDTSRESTTSDSGC